MSIFQVTFLADKDTVQVHSLYVDTSRFLFSTLSYVI